MSADHQFCSKARQCVFVNKDLTDWLHVVASCSLRLPPTLIYDQHHGPLPTNAEVCIYEVLHVGFKLYRSPVAADPSQFLHLSPGTADLAPFRGTTGVLPRETAILYYGFCLRLSGWSSASFREEGKQRSRIRSITCLSMKQKVPGQDSITVRRGQNPPVIQYERWC